MARRTTRDGSRGGIFGSDDLETRSTTDSASGSVFGRDTSVSLEHLTGARGPTGTTGATGPRGVVGPQGPLAQGILSVGVVDDGVTTTVTGYFDTDETEQAFEFQIVDNTSVAEITAERNADDDGVTVTISFVDGRTPTTFDIPDGTDGVGIGSVTSEALPDGTGVTLSFFSDATVPALISDVVVTISGANVPDFTDTRQLDYVLRYDGSDTSWEPEQQDTLVSINGNPESIVQIDLDAPSDVATGGVHFAFSDANNLTGSVEFPANIPETQFTIDTTEEDAITLTTGTAGNTPVVFGFDANVLTASVEIPAGALQDTQVFIGGTTYENTVNITPETAALPATNTPVEFRFDSGTNILTGSVDVPAEVNPNVPDFFVTDIARADMRYEILTDAAGAPSWTTSVAGSDTTYDLTVADSTTAAAVTLSSNTDPDDVITFTGADATVVSTTGNAVTITTPAELNPRVPNFPADLVANADTQFAVTTDAAGAPTGWAEVSNFATTDLTFTTIAAVDGGSLAYDNTTGTFTYAPAELNFTTEAARSAVAFDVDVTTNVATVTGIGNGETTAETLTIQGPTQANDGTFRVGDGTTDGIITVTNVPATPAREATEADPLDYALRVLPGGASDWLAITPGGGNSAIHDTEVFIGADGSTETTYQSRVNIDTGTTTIADALAVDFEFANNDLTARIDKSGLLEPDDFTYSTVPTLSEPIVFTQGVGTTAITASFDRGDFVVHDDIDNVALPTDNVSVAFNISASNDLTAAIDKTTLVEYTDFGTPADVAGLTPVTFAADATTSIVTATVPAIDLTPYTTTMLSVIDTDVGLNGANEVVSIMVGTEVRTIAQPDATVDATLNNTSMAAVQNRVIFNAIETLDQGVAIPFSSVANLDEDGYDSVGQFFGYDDNVLLIIAVNDAGPDLNDTRITFLDQADNSLLDTQFFAADGTVPISPGNPDGDTPTALTDIRPDLYIVKFLAEVHVIRLVRFASSLDPFDPGSADLIDYTQAVIETVARFNATENLFVNASIGRTADDFSNGSGWARFHPVALLDEDTTYASGVGTRAGGGATINLSGSDGTSTQVGVIGGNSITVTPNMDNTFTIDNTFQAQEARDALAFSATETDNTFVISALGADDVASTVTIDGFTSARARTAVGLELTQTTGIPQNINWNTSDDDADDVSVNVVSQIVTRSGSTFTPDNMGSVLVNSIESDDVALEGEGQATSGAAIVAFRIHDADGNETWHRVGAAAVVTPENPMAGMFTTQRFEQGVNGGTFTNTLDISVNTPYGIGSTLHNFRVTRSDGSLITIDAPTLSAPVVANGISTRTVTFTFPEETDNTADTITVHFQPTISADTEAVTTVNPAFNESFAVFVPAVSLITVPIDNVVLEDSDADTHLFVATTTFATGAAAYNFMSTGQPTPTVVVDDIAFDESTVTVDVVLVGDTLTYTATFPVGYEDDTRVFTFRVTPTVIRETLNGAVPTVPAQVWTFTVEAPAELTEFYYGVDPILPSGIATFVPTALSNMNAGPYALSDGFTMEGTQADRAAANSFIIAIPNSIRGGGAIVDGMDLNLGFRETITQVFNNLAGGAIVNKGSFWNSALIDIGNTQYYIIAIGLTDTGGGGALSRFFTDQWRLT